MSFLIPKHSWLVLLLFGALLFSSASYANDHDHPEDEWLSDDNLLIVNLILGKYLLASDIFIYSSPEATIVPLQPLLDGLEFPILVDPVSKKANGWFLRESNKFDLDVNANYLIINGQKIDLPSNAIIVSDDYDLYVDIKLLAKWFPFSSHLDISKLQIVIDSSSPLPVELQLAREKQRSKDKPFSTAKTLPHNDDNYRLLGSPVFDVNLAAITQDTDTGINYDGSYSIQGSMDMLGTQSSFSLSRSALDEHANKRLTFYKRPNNLYKTMPGGLSYFAAGDIFAVSDALIFNGGDGLGADFQFGGFRQSTDFGKRAIEGDATPGWEVELYRNNALVDFIVVGQDGRYHFTDVSVEYGENIFDIRLFGPQGQERSHRESIRVGEQAIPKGKIYARSSHINLNKNVFHQANNNIATLQTADEEKTHLFIQGGITDWLSSSASYAQHKNPSTNIDTNEYIELGINASLPHAAIGFRYAAQKNGGHASLLSAQTRLGNAALSYSHKYFSDFSSDRNPLAKLKNDIELRVSGTAYWLTRAPWSYQFSSGYQNDINGNYNYQLENRLGIAMFNGRMTLNTDYSSDQNNNTFINGRARYLRSMGAKLNVRASLDYKIHPNWQLSSGTAAITWRPQKNTRTQLSVNADFTGNDNNSLDFSYSRLFKTFTLSANTTIREGGHSSFLLSAEFSLSQENKRKWRIGNEPQANYGRVKAKVFLDNDANGIQTDVDQPLAGIRFSGYSNWNALQTDEQGVVFLSGLRSDHHSRLKLNHGSLEDPYWKSLFEQQVFTSHGGGLHEISIPVLATVEAEGNLMLKHNGKLRPFAGVPLTIKNQQGETVATVISEFDGFFIVTGLMPGHYQISLEAKALQQLNLNHFEAINFFADAELGVVYLETISLEKNTQQPNWPTTTNTQTDDSTLQQIAPVAAKQNQASNLATQQTSKLLDKNNLATIKADKPIKTAIKNIAPTKRFVSAIAAPTKMVISKAFEQAQPVPHKAEKRPSLPLSPEPTIAENTTAVSSEKPLAWHRSRLFFIALCSLALTLSVFIYKRLTRLHR